MTTQQPDRPALLPADHRERVLALLKEVGIDTEGDNCYVAHNGVVRVKVAHRTAEEWLALSGRITALIYRRGWDYLFSHAELFIEPCDELLFRPPEAMR